MTSNEIRRKLRAAGFSILRDSKKTQAWGRDGISVVVQRGTGNTNPHTIREVEQALRRATEWMARFQPKEKTLKPWHKPLTTRLADHIVSVADSHTVVSPEEHRKDQIAAGRSMPDTPAENHQPKSPPPVPTPLVAAPVTPSTSWRPVAKSRETPTARSRRLLQTRTVELYHEGFGSEGIASRLREEGFVTATGQTITAQTVNCLFTVMGIRRTGPDKLAINPSLAKPKIPLPDIPVREELAIVSSAPTAVPTPPIMLPPSAAPTRNGSVGFIVPPSLELMIDDPDMSDAEKMAVLSAYRKARQK